jgi:hypothetical protein
MGLHLTALGMKWLSVWVVLLLFGLSFGPNPGQAAVMAVFVAVVSWLADRAMPFKVQGVTRWAIDSGLAFVALYLGQFLWPGTGITFYTALFAGFVIGAIEIPLHFWLAARFGVRAKGDDRDGIR